MTESKKGQKKRDLNADLIRCAAVYSVVSVHFLLNSKFYTQPVVGNDMLIMCVMRACFMVCVPMFMILTGYLMWRKSFCAGYYKGIWKTASVYVLASIACLFFKKFYLGNEVTLGSGIADILDYDAANYSWYIEMYFGLFLIIPFLNGAYHSLENKKQKQALILIMMSLTMFPKVINLFNFTQPGWWAAPSLSKDYQKIVPSFFTTMYPITYYFIGAYLREYGCFVGKYKSFGFYTAFAFLFGAYNFYRSDGGKFVWGANSTWGGENLITAVFLFMFLLQLQPQRWPAWIRRLITWISGLSLGTYLLSWIADQLIYPVFRNIVTDPYIRWRYYIIVVPSVFLLSNAFSWILYRIKALLDYGLSKLPVRER